ncbi:hypothetical protein D3C71_1936530 [compost metagenome]
MCSTCRRVPCFLASDTASSEDFRQASRERMSGCCSALRASPYFSAYSLALASIIGVSSQCVMIGVGASRKIASSVSGLSTSMLPVDAPMNTLMPGAVLGSSDWI